MLSDIVWCHIFMSSRWLAAFPLPLPFLQPSTVKALRGAECFLSSFHFIISSPSIPPSSHQGHSSSPLRLLPPPPPPPRSFSSYNNNKVSQVESYVLPSSSQLDPSCICSVSLPSSTRSPASSSSPIFVTGLRHQEGSTLWPPTWQHQAETELWCYCTLKRLAYLLKCCFVSWDGFFFLNKSNTKGFFLAENMFLLFYVSKKKNNQKLELFSYNFPSFCWLDLPVLKYWYWFVKTKVFLLRAGSNCRRLSYLENVFGTAAVLAPCNLHKGNA